MLKNERLVALVHCFSLSLLTALLVSVGTAIPLLGFWGMLLCPLPLALLGCRHGVRWMGTGLLLTTGLLLLLPTLALYFTLGGFPVSLALVLAARRRPNWTGSESLTVCVLASLGAKLLLLAGFWALTGRNVLLPDMGQTEALLRSLSLGLPLDEAQEVRTAIRQTLALFPYLMPSMLLLYSMLDATLNYRLCCHFQRGVVWSGASKLPVLPPFSQWRFPRSLLPAMVLSFVLGWLIKPERWLHGAMFALNLRLVVNVLFFVQGLSLALWWMERRGWGRVLRWLCVAILLFPLMWTWTILLGVGDMAFDFRARAERKTGGA
ncbi:MAG: DUF2232 domain-containing protein [Synergistaceae bacterium]|nr:DUF2232 domain-containing protein [Synergistaceae bacterium]